MKLTTALGAFLLLSCATPALAQSYPGQEVTVNPTALGRGYLLYPGGQYGRNVGNLLEPGAKRSDWGVVRLHMPVKRPRVARPRPAPVAPPVDSLTTPDTTMAAAPPPPPPPKPTKPAPTRTAAATPPAPLPHAPTGGAADLSSLPEDSAARLAGFPSGPASAKPPKPAPAKPPVRTASTTPPPTNTTPTPAIDAGLSIQASVPFAVGASSPTNADVNAVHALASSLKAALNAGASRVQLQAFGGPKGDKGSDSRRLSLKRALVIRELLIEDGVPSEKIDVRAMGGADDNAGNDRVDVYLRS